MNSNTMGALRALDDPLVVRTYERVVEILWIIPSISSDFCSNVMYQLREKNASCGDSILAKFSIYRSYGVHNT